MLNSLRALSDHGGEAGFTLPDLRAAGIGPRHVHDLRRLVTTGTCGYLLVRSAPAITDQGRRMLAGLAQGRRGRQAGPGGGPGCAHATCRPPGRASGGAVSGGA